MKRATQTKQYAELDHAIKTKVEPFLYNKGKGRLVPVAQLVLMRNCDRSRTKLVSRVMYRAMLLLLRVREAFCPRRRPHSGPIEL